MRPIALAVALTLGLVAAIPSAQPPQTASPSRRMSVTIDDLPWVHRGAAAYLDAARKGTTAILDALRTRRAPAIGFVNESKLDGGTPAEREARIALLRQWVDAGHALGNHTYSHRDACDLSVEEYVADIEKGERVTRGLTRDLHWFRHPMTHTGESPEKKDGIAKALAARGYKIAPHTVENADFRFNQAYGRADAETRAKLREAYIDYTLAATEFAEAKAAELFGRPYVPQVLVIHANQVNADALGTLLDRLQARGYRFISLDAAGADAAYQTPDVYVGRFGPSWLFRWSRTLAPATNFKGDPEPPEWAMALADQAQAR